MVTTQWEPKQRDPRSGTEFKQTFNRTSWYANPRKTDFAMMLEYWAAIEWKALALDKNSAPVGTPYDRTSYETTFEFILNAYSGHSTLLGIVRATAGKKNNEVRDIGPSEYDPVSVYLSADDVGRPVLRMDVSGLFPRVISTSPDDEPQLIIYDSFETVWIEDGKIHRRQLWRDYLVDPQILTNSRPLTEEKVV